jgi:hypothetical protein
MRPRSEGSASEALDDTESSRLIKTPDRIRRDRREAVFLFALILLQCVCLLLALSGHSRETRECPLLGGKADIG